MLQYYTVHKMNPNQLITIWNQLTNIELLGKRN